MVELSCETWVVPPYCLPVFDSGCQVSLSPILADPCVQTVAALHLVSAVSAMAREKPCWSDREGRG